MVEAQTTEERIYRTLAAYTEKAAAREIAAELEAKDKRIAELEGLLREAETMIKNADVSVNTLTKAGDMLAARLDQALAEVEKLRKAFSTVAKKAKGLSDYVFGVFE